MSQGSGQDPSETTLADVKQLGLWASLASLSYVFWIVGGMEIVERLAYTACGPWPRSTRLAPPRTAD